MPSPLWMSSPHDGSGKKFHGSIHFSAGADLLTIVNLMPPPTFWMAFDVVEPGNGPLSTPTPMRGASCSSLRMCFWCLLSTIQSHIRFSAFSAASLAWLSIIFTMSSSVSGLGCPSSPGAINGRLVFGSIAGFVLPFLLTSSGTGVGLALNALPSIDNAISAIFAAAMSTYRVVSRT